MGCQWQTNGSKKLHGEASLQFHPQVETKQKVKFLKKVVVLGKRKKKRADYKKIVYFCNEIKSAPTLLKSEVGGWWNRTSSKKGVIFILPP